LKKAGINIQAPIAIQTTTTFPEGTRTTFKTPLQDKKVRLALNYAVDRQGLADKLFGGYAKPALQPAIPGTPSYIPNLQPFPYDPAMAKKLLAEAGYPNGFTLTNGFDYTTGQVITDVPVAIQGYLKDVGVNVELIADENTVFVDKAYGRNNLVKGDLWIGRSGDTTGFGPTRTLNGCGKPAGAPASALFSCIPEWDTTLDQVYAETDANKRAELLKKVTQISLDNVTNLLLFYEPNYLVASPKIKNLQIVHPVLYTVDTVYRVK
jgi:peptide/nickel transport system substrate-binding protein